MTEMDVLVLRPTTAAAERPALPQRKNENRTGDEAAADDGKYGEP